MDEWSDEDDTDDKYIMKVGQQKVIIYGEEIPSDLIIDQPDLIDPVTRAHDHKRSFYSGNVRAQHPIKQYVDLKAPLTLIQDPHADPIKFNLPLAVPIPKIPSHTYNTVDSDVVSYIWYECIQHGCDESELVKIRWLPSIGKAVTKHLGYSLPFDKLTCTKGMEKDDYLEFIELVVDLVSIIANTPLYKPKVVDKPFICCSFPACIHKKDSSVPCPNSVVAKPPLQRTNTNKSLPPDISDEHSDLFSPNELFRINVVYHRMMQEQNGILRIRHVFDICRELNIAYDKHQLPRHVALNCTEFLVKSQEECRDLIDTIRVREKVVFDPTAELFKFTIPKWLKEEFKGSEILLYEHHFMLIDVDGGGSIDAEELQQLLLGFGTKVPLDEAQMILDEYDIDGGGTIDFVEFMILIYRIQRGTVEMENNELAQALMEAKSQLPIFEEILEVKKEPPQFCSVIHFGNTPVEATFSVEGPPDTIYAGAKIVLQLVFHDGYPYRQPDIKILNRVFHVNVISQLDGGGRFLHIKEMWSSDWSICKLLAHFIDILRRPDLTLLPENLKSIYDAWSDKLYLDMLMRVPDYKKEVERRKQMENLESKASDAAAATAESKNDQNTDSNRLSEAKKPTSADCKRAEQKDSKEGVNSARQSESKTAESKSEPANSESDCKKSAEELEPIVPGKYLPYLSIEMLSNEITKKKIAKLSRIEQMHLTVLFTHLTDSRKFQMAVADYIKKYNYVESERESPDNEGEEEKGKND